MSGDASIAYGFSVVISKIDYQFLGKIPACNDIFAPTVKNS